MAATVEQNEDEKEKLSPFDRAARKFGDYFKRQGLGARDIPAAIVVHELLGLLIAASAWAICYKVQPSQRLGKPMATVLGRARSHAQIQRAYSIAMDKATKTVQRLSWFIYSPTHPPQLNRSTLPASSNAIDPRRLTVSLAESIVMRAGMKPITFVFKLWASYEIVKHGKNLQRSWKDPFKG